MRYTIPGYLNECARVTVRKEPMSRGEWWAIIRRRDRLRGFRGDGAVVRAAPVHREQVRFGAWEERPSSAFWDHPKPCACCQIPWAIPDEATRAAEARSGAGVGMGEGPADSGGSESNKCKVVA